MVDCTAQQTFQWQYAYLSLILDNQAVAHVSLYPVFFRTTDKLYCFSAINLHRFWNTPASWAKSCTAINSITSRPFSCFCDKGSMLPLCKVCLSS